MVYPKILEIGDTVGLLAPSFPVEQDKVSQCVKKLEEIGYRVKISRALKERCNLHNYLAGDGKIRAEDVNNMFADKEIKGILCIRGGYGSTHMINWLDFDLIRQNPKVFVGYSDVTNLNIALGRLCGLVTFHGPMVFSNMLNHYDDYTKGSFEAAVQRWDKLEFENPTGKDFKVIREGRASGRIVGGNLSVIARGIGSFFQLQTSDKILFLEEIEESIPVLDMLISQLEHAGLFRRARGLLLGNFSNCNNNTYDPGYTIDMFFKERFRCFDLPVMSQIQSGHDKPMGTIPLGAMCTVDTYQKRIWFLKD